MDINTTVTKLGFQNYKMVSSTVGPGNIELLGALMKEGLYDALPAVNTFF